jgi:uncharacterized protein (DUF488 family)
MTSTPIIDTFGHSTRSLDEIVRILRAQEVCRLADVRRYPASRTQPHVNAAVLAIALSEHGIAYVHLAGLGGRRHGLRPDSRNDGLYNPQFRAYADYMQTPEFRSALEELIALADREQTAMMCSEAVPWRCHRWLISDALVVRGRPVCHILSERSVRDHHLSRLAVVEGETVTYPARTDGS